jgi:hypothetical protein
MESVINLFLYIARCHYLEVAKATNSHNQRPAEKGFRLPPL